VACNDVKKSNRLQALSRTGNVYLPHNQQERKSIFLRWNGLHPTFFSSRRQNLRQMDFETAFTSV
jgi:hypothetical protein